ncbi:MAG: hypothetical protein RLZZ450_6059 [Pseudomonadota bacterium]
MKLGELANGLLVVPLERHGVAHLTRLRERRAQNDVLQQNPVLASNPRALCARECGGPSLDQGQHVHEVRGQVHDPRDVGVERRGGLSGRRIEYANAVARLERRTVGSSFMAEPPLQVIRSFHFLRNARCGSELREQPPRSAVGTSRPHSVGQRSVLGDSTGLRCQRGIRRAAGGKESKTVILRDDQGRRFAIEADTNAAARLRPNDRIKAVYQESLAFALEDPNKPHDDVETKVEDSDEKKGPDGVQFGRRITTKVEIVAVAPEGKSVEFRVPEGQVRTVAIDDPKHQSAVQNLHPGDSVQVTFTEKLALAVDESAGS